MGEPFPPFTITLLYHPCLLLPVVPSKYHAWFSFGYILCKNIYFQSQKRSFIKVFLNTCHKAPLCLRNKGVGVVEMPHIWQNTQCPHYIASLDPSLIFLHLSEYFWDNRGPRDDITTEVVAAMYRMLINRDLSAAQSDSHHFGQNQSSPSAVFANFAKTMFTLVSVAASLTRAMQDQDHGLNTRTPALLVTDIGSDPDDIMALLVLLASDKFQVDTNIYMQSKCTGN